MKKNKEYRHPLSYLKPAKYNDKITDEEADEIIELIIDLKWEMDRMSSSGRETLSALWKILKIENQEEENE
jgi:hypothetical protein